MKRKTQFWWLEPEERYVYVWDKINNKWSYIEDLNGNYYKGEIPCRSLKSAKRHLKKHDEISVGMKFVLVGRFDNLRLIKRRIK